MGTKVQYKTSVKYLEVLTLYILLIILCTATNLTGCTTVIIVNDTIIESSESFSLNLRPSRAGGRRVDLREQNETTITIIDDDRGV